MPFDISLRFYLYGQRLSLEHIDQLYWNVRNGGIKSQRLIQVVFDSIFFAVLFESFLPLNDLLLRTIKSWEIRLLSLIVSEHLYDFFEDMKISIDIDLIVLSPDP